ncbi:hypothetical protein Lalb_Chr23g0273291 [Lupinus albus]|uniref:Uncharacterized protein n=1 Tax=Lupinus albus TaxID=3870 RepID=A0A6A4MWM5_LUPAL|nr:hypothetical protein Lalb_Chr23g0273291 [Lupinus albus]
MGERTRNSTTSLDPLDSFPPLRLHQSDGDDAASPSSRYSSCGDSDFDRYCSANSAMGTPSVRSTVSLYNDFSELDFGSVKGFEIGDDSNRSENFSLGGGGRAGINQIDDNKFGTALPSLGYGGLEFYGDDGGDELAVIGFNNIESFEECGGGNELKGVDGYVGISSSCSNESGNVGNGERIVLRDVDGPASSVMVEEGGGIVRLDSYDSQSRLEGGEREMEREGVEGLSDCEEHTMGEASMYNYGAGGESGLSCGAVGIDDFDVRSKLDCGERETETEREEDGGLSDFEHSEGENSMYSYGSDGENKNESYLSRVIHYRNELEMRNENPLLINSSVAFGSDDLDDFLLENVRCDPVSMSNPFHSRREMDHEVGEDPENFGSVSLVGCISASQKEAGKDKKDMAIINEKLEELKGIGEPVAIEVVTDTPTCVVNDFLNTVNPQDQGSDNLVKTATITEACEVSLDPLAEEAHQCMSMNVKDSGSLNKGDQDIFTENAIATSDAQHVKKSELDHSKIKFDQFSDSRLNQNLHNSSNHIGNINVKSLKRSEQNVPPSNRGMKKTLESYPTSTNLLETSPVISKASS